MRKRYFQAFITILFIAFSIRSSAQIVRYYVDSAKGNDAHSGTSWASAYRNLNKAIATADTSKAAEVDIWVAKGTYRPNEGLSSLPADPADTAFTLYRGDGVGKALKLYGGFRGNEISINGRDTNHVTYLDGTLSKTLHSYHIAVIAGLAPNADSVVLNGFTIINGYAWGDSAKIYNGDTLSPSLAGGIYLKNDSTSKLLLSNCKIELSINGLSCIGSTVMIDNCSFISNEGYLGGGVYIEGGKPEIRNSTFFNNNIASGAALFINDCEMDVTNCKFISNNAVVGSSPGYGGAIYISSASPRIKHCVFDGNYTYGDGYAYGGAIYIFRKKTFMPVIDSCLFINNAVHGVESGFSFGGAIYNDYSSPSITNCIFKNNLADSWGEDYDGGGISGGGAIYNNFSSPIIYNCNFSGNVARGYGFDGGSSYSGYGYGLGGAIYNYYSPLTISNCSFKSDTAQGVRDETTFAGYGYGYGGGLYNFQSAVNVNNCTFDSETALTNLKMLYGGGFAGGGYGGAICNTNASPVVVTNCSFKSNTATTHGGGIFHTDNKLTVKNCLFSNNTAMNGGAINFTYTFGTGASASFTGYNNIFAGNSATYGVGGAINSDMGIGDDTLINSLFVDNKALDSNGGGAMDVTRGNHYIYNNTFYADSAIGGNGRGGALHFEDVYGVFNIANNIFNKNYGTATSADTSITPSGVYYADHNIYTGGNAGFINTTNLQGADNTWGTADDGLELQKCSPARNAGALRYVLTDEHTDITGAARVESDSVDIGAYETNPLGRIAGVADVCAGFYLTLSDTTTGGTWISKNSAIATINSAGVLKGISAGIDTILYAVNGLCSVDTIATIVRVHDASNSGVINGITTICAGSTTVLTDSINDGMWSVTNANATVSNGIVTGILPGLDTVKYSNSCAMSVAMAVITIKPLPTAGIIEGKDSVCLGETILLSDTAMGGVWYSQKNYVDISASGLVTGLSTGIDTIMYTVHTECGTTIARKAIISANCNTMVRSTEAYDVNNITVLPNPNNGVFNITIRSAENEQVRGVITDITGKQEKTFVITTNKPAAMKIDGPAGLYFLSARTATKRYTVKILKD